MSEWISVEDGLPEEKQVVLIYSSHINEVLYGHFYKRLKTWAERYIGIEIKGVTHWMPLPPPPGDNEG